MLPIAVDQTTGFPWLIISQLKTPTKVLPGMLAIFLTTLTITAPVFAMLFLGVLLKRIDWINDNFIHTASSLVFNVTMPALLFLGILHADLHSALKPGLLIYFAVATLAALALMYRPLVLECLDPQFLRSVSRFSALAHYGFLVLVVICLVAGFHALGTLMAVGIMVLPAATARLWVRGVPALMALAAALALAACVAGLLISYHADWPTSPTIVLNLGAVYLVSLLVGRHGAWRSGQHGRQRHLRA